MTKYKIPDSVKQEFQRQYRSYKNMLSYRIDRVTGKRLPIYSDITLNNAFSYVASNLQYWDWSQEWNQSMVREVVNTMIMKAISKESEAIKLENTLQLKKPTEDIEKPLGIPLLDQFYEAFGDYIETNEKPV